MKLHTTRETIKNLLKTLLPGLLALSAYTFAQNQEVRIPRSMSGDMGEYYLLSQEQRGNIIHTLHKRVGLEAVGYTRSEINCQTMKMRQIGYSEISPQAIKKHPSQWFDLVPGSSKSDLANFVCSGQIKSTSDTSDQKVTGTDTLITLLIIGGIIFFRMHKKKQRQATITKSVNEILDKEWKVGEQLIKPEWAEKDQTGYANELIALDKKNRIFGIVKTLPDYHGISVAYDRIIKSEVVVDSESIMQTSTNRGSQLVGALAGSAIAGGVGAIIGGTTGSKTSKIHKQINSVELKILTMDGIINIPFSTDNLKLATKWHDLATIAMHSVKPTR